MEALSRIPPLSEKAADALLSEIVGGRWKVGDQLPGEMALAAEMHVGRSTIREAIRLLAARGMLATHQGVGVFLTATNPPGTIRPPRPGCRDHRRGPSPHSHRNPSRSTSRPTPSPR